VPEEIPPPDVLTLLLAKKCSFFDVLFPAEDENPPWTRSQSALFPYETALPQETSCAEARDMASGPTFRASFFQALFARYQAESPQVNAPPALLRFSFAALDGTQG